MLNRFLQIVDHYGITKSSFEASIGASNGFFNKMKDEKAKVDINKLALLLKEYPEINIMWLITGKGEMLKSKESNEPVGIKSNEGIPLIPIDVIAGYGGGEFSVREQDIQERYVVPDFNRIDFMIRVNGSSMYPKYNSGDVIACRFITESNFIQWGKVHVIYTREQGAIVKRLFKGNKTDTYVCRSDNNNYPEFELQKNDILNIALVIGVIRLE